MGRAARAGADDPDPVEAERRGRGRQLYKIYVCGPGHGGPAVVSNTSGKRRRSH